MNNKLVAYFSASGQTARVAKALAQAAGADLYEIRPAVPYTDADLDWRDSGSRSSIEMTHKAQRPALAESCPDVSGYDTVYLGFPIWWYVAPTLVNAFLESGDFSGKKIILFATSGSSGFGDTLAELQPSAPGAQFVEGGLLSGLLTDGKIAKLAAELA